MSQAQSNQVTAFDLITTGVGYLNRVRDVAVKKGPGYLACTINAMMGTGEDVEYLSFDCRVVGAIAKDVVQQLRADVDAKHKVIVGFRCGDAKPDSYEIERDGKTEVRTGMKARLLQVTFAKVNGQRVAIPVVDRPAAGNPDSPFKSESSREPAAAGA
ncbi:MAG: DUF3577 domain-containing protein [Rubrivivax sp.]